MLKLLELEIGQRFFDLGECQSEHFYLLKLGGHFLLQKIDLLRLDLIAMPGFWELFFKMSSFEPELIDLLLSSIGIGQVYIHDLV
jgi:hypothetical protein